MKIIIATDNYYPNVNGASYFTQRLARGLLKEGHKILIITPSRHKQDERFKQNGINIFGIRSIPLERIRIARPFGVKQELKKIIKEFSPDIIHIQSHFAVSRKTAIIARELKIPVIGTNHFMPGNLIAYLPLPNFIAERTGNIFWYFFLKVFKKIDAVTSPTYSAAASINRIGLLKPVHVISNGLDLGIFKASNRGEYLKEQYNLPNNPILLSVGRLDKDKNLDLVIKAFALSIKKITINLVIVGGGAERKNLENLVKELDLESMVTFTGFVPDNDLPNLYPLADCFVIAGPYELQSLVTMEAMASGLPVIAVRALALPELVKDKENGFLYPDRDVKLLSDDIVSIFSDSNLRRTMSLKSQEFIKKHDINNTINSFVNLYKDLLKK